MKNHDFLYLLITLHIAKHPYLLGFEHQEYVRTLSFEKWCRMHKSTSQMDVWSTCYDNISSMTRVLESSYSMTFPIAHCQSLRPRKKRFSQPFSQPFFEHIFLLFRTAFLVNKLRFLCLAQARGRKVGRTDESTDEHTGGPTEGRAKEPVD